MYPSSSTVCSAASPHAPFGDDWPFATPDGVPLLTDFRLPEFGIHAIYPHRRHLAAKVRAFIDLLAERFIEHERWMNFDAASPKLRSWKPGN